MLELGFFLLLSDADVVWFQNLFHVREVTGSPLNLMSDAHFGFSMGGTQTFVNSGFAYMAPDPSTLSFMRGLRLASRPDKIPTPTTQRSQIGNAAQLSPGLQRHGP